MQRALEKGSFLRRYFTPGEQAYILAKGKAAAQSLAGHFAAKEACVKALGCGLSIPLEDIEITHNAAGAPAYVLHRKAWETMLACGGSVMHLSITHTDQVAAAVAVLEGD